MTYNLVDSLIVWLILDILVIGSICMANIYAMYDEARKGKKQWYTRNIMSTY